MQYNYIIDSLQKLIYRKPTQQEIADILGVGQTAINGRAKRNSDFSKDEIKKIENHYNVIILSDNTEILTNDCVEKVTLDYYPDLDFSCGNGLMPLSGTKEQMTIPTSLIKGYKKERKYIIVNAKSDSMEPEIKPNDLLIIRMIDTEPIIDNHIYIFCYDERLYCKYLSWNIHQIIVRSANPDYKTQLIEKENINLFQLYGEVVGHFRSYMV